MIDSFLKDPETQFTSSYSNVKYGKHLNQLYDCIPQHY